MSAAAKFFALSLARLPKTASTAKSTSASSCVMAKLGEAETELPENGANKFVRFRLCKLGSAVSAGGTSGGVQLTEGSGLLAVMVGEVAMALSVVQLHDFGRCNPLST